jgi:hypothetical protein
MDYGDSYVFGVGVQNLQPMPDDFYIKAYFDKAYDKYTNAIEVDEDLMNSWIKSNLRTFTLESGEKATISIKIEVGETLPGVMPSPGAYVFDVETLYKKGGYHANKEYIGKKEITIKVQ